MAQHAGSSISWLLVASPSSLPVPICSIGYRALGTIQPRRAYILTELGRHEMSVTSFRHEHDQSKTPDYEVQPIILLLHPFLVVFASQTYIFSTALMDRRSSIVEILDDMCVSSYVV
jgi:hypothetical protein